MKLSRSALLPYTAAQMYQIVADLDAYPAFLPGCDSVDVLERNGDQVVAKLMSNFSKLEIDFTTRNMNCKNESIEMSLEQGPFQSLQGLWTFKALSESACRIDFEIDFEMKGGLMKKLLNPMFEKLMNMQFDAFQQRAKQLYS